MVADGGEADGGGDEGGEGDIVAGLYAEMIASKVGEAADECGGGVDFSAKDEGDLGAEEIAEDAAEGGGD